MNRTCLAALVLAALAGACKTAGHPTPATPAPEPSLEARYEALPDTTVCVVDRTTRRGLRNLTAKREANGRAVLLVSGRVEPLDSLHPVGVVAGYAGREPWIIAGEPITVAGRRYQKVEGERRVPLDLVQRIDDFRAIPVFADPSDPPPPRAVYVPLRPGCVFQAFVRDDLLR